MLYYNLATVKVIEQAIIVLIQFDRNESFKLMTIHPFPVFLNNTPIIWDHSPLHLLFHDQGATIITLKKEPAVECIVVFERFYCKAMNLQQLLLKLLQALYF